MSVISKAQATWTGSLASGNGTVSLSSSQLGNFPLTWKARSENAPSADATTPEELLGAAYASCYSMALANLLAQEGVAVESISTGADVTFDPEKGITNIHLYTVGRVEGLATANFETIAQRAKKDCPVSRALKGVDIDVTASLA